MSAPFGLPPDDVRHDEALVGLILKYLAERPNATDTLDGIAEWWVMGAQTRVNVETLARVLRRLTDEGVLEETRAGSQVLYSLRQRTTQGV